MSYGANWSCTIELKKPLPKELLDEAEFIFEYGEVYNNELYLSGSGNYHEYEVYDILNKLTPYAKSGCAEFIGEDDGHWQIVLENNKWNEYSGRMIYQNEAFIKEKSDKEELVGQLIDQIEDALSREKVCVAGSRYESIKQKIFSTLTNWRVI